MAKIAATVDFTEVEGDYGSMDGVEVTCTRCGHSEQSGGTDERSIDRCAVLLRENCPRGESNFYVVGFEP